MRSAHRSATLMAVLLVCLLTTSTIEATPKSPVGSEPPSTRDGCEDIGKYLNADSDRDGLSGYRECQLGTSNQESDSDGDGLDDGEEVWLGTDPTLWDTDGDLLSDCWEHEAVGIGLPADPLQAGPDADGDLIADDLELDKGLDPNDIDTDDDMLGDGEEALPLSCGVKEIGWYSARHFDTDNDGLGDGVEITSFGTYPYDADTDDDGISDGDEVYLWGSDPLDPDDPSSETYTHP